jgi:chitinase
MVNQALAMLQRERPGVTVSYTLRVQSDDFGVDPFSVQILQSAVRNGVRVSIVNPMVMLGGDRIFQGFSG